MAMHSGFISSPDVICAYESSVIDGWVLMQEDIFLYLFIYVFLLQRGVQPPAELINAASVLRPLWVNAATYTEKIR